MDAEQLKQVQAEIASAVDLAGNVAGMIVPGQAAYIALGRALAVLAPQLYVDAVNLFQGKEPAAEDVQALAEDVHALLNPETA